jgi:hypothetical protein
MPVPPELQPFWSAAQAANARECVRIGREPHPRMEVLCERFRVVYQADGPDVQDLGWDQA